MPQLRDLPHLNQGIQAIPSTKFERKLQGILDALLQEDPAPDSAVEPAIVDSIGSCVSPLHGACMSAPDLTHQSMKLPSGSVVAISGPVCSGKTTLAAALRCATGARILTTRLLIADHLGRSPDELTRGELQAAGEALDEERGGDWVAAGVASLTATEGDLIVVDAVRNLDQLVALREERFTSHVHLTADPEVLADRYAVRSRNNPQLEFPDLQSLRANPTEARVGKLRSFATLELDTGATGADGVLHFVMEMLRKDP